MLIVLLILQSFTGTGVIGVKTETTTVTATLSSQEVNIVSDSFASHLNDFESMNILAFVEEYEHNATIRWAGDLNPCCRMSPSPGGLQLALNQGLWFGLGSSAQIVDVVGLNEVFSASADNYVVLNATFVLEGTSSLFGNFNSTVQAHELYAYSTWPQDAWLIGQESWNFLNFKCQVVPPSIARAHSFARVRQVSVALIRFWPRASSWLNRRSSELRI